MVGTNKATVEAVERAAERALNGSVEITDHGRTVEIRADCSGHGGARLVRRINRNEQLSIIYVAGEEAGELVIYVSEVRDS